MIALFYYLLKVIICSGLLFGYYHLALRNKLFHQWNRFYLLSAVALSLLLPLLQITIWQTAENQTGPVQIIQVVQSADNYLEEFTISNKKVYSTEALFWVGYVLVSAVLLVFLLLAVFRLWRLLSKHESRWLGTVRFVDTAEPGTPFSFFHFIFWNREISLQSSVGQRIFQHELVHVQERHTADKLSMQLVLIAFWCNPFFWLMRRELKAIHEFIADKKAVGDEGTAAFAAMILQSAFPRHYNTLVNPFFQTAIKRRIAMLTKINHPRRAYLSRIIALPLIALIGFAFTVRTKTLAPSYVPDQLKTISLSGERWQVAGGAYESPFLSEPKGSEKMMVDTVPKTAKDIESVDLNYNRQQVTFFFKDGSCETMTETAARKRGLIPVIEYYLRKRSKVVIEKPEKEATVNANFSTLASGEVATLEGDFTAYQTLYFLDGKEITVSELNATKPSAIQSINVLKGPSATGKYGRRGAKGVVEITTRAAGASGQLTINDGGKEVVSGDFTELKIDSGNRVHFRAHTVRMITDTTTPTPVFTKPEFEAMVDKTEWRKFLEKSMMPVVEAASAKGALGTYTVNVRFLVDLDGSISNITTLNDPGFGMAESIVRLMKDSPKWQPATQNKKPVRSYHVQPITLHISAQ